MKYYAVIDTNVIVAALLTKNKDSATLQVLNAVLGGTIIPLYHQNILAEYNDVLHRPKFPLQEDTIQFILKAITQYGVEVFPQSSGEIFIDMDDLIFYEIALEKREDDAYLITGNQQHYPIKDFIVTPAEMLNIIKGNN